MRFDFPSKVPLFTLSGAVLMPRTKLPLHIFEPRYLQMLDDALKTDHRLVGVIQPDEDGLCAVGCAGRVVAFSESDDNRLFITLRASSRFRLRQVEEGFSPYLRGQIDWAGFERDQKGPETDSTLDRPLLMDRLRRYAEAHDFKTDWEVASSIPDERLINSMAMMLPFSSRDKQALLEAMTLTQRREILEGLLDFFLAGGEGEDRLQ